MLTLKFIPVVLIISKDVFGFPFIHELLGKEDNQHEDPLKVAFKDYVTEGGTNKGTLIMRAEDWKPESCNAKEFNQTVHHFGCLERKVKNRYCYGQCNSIYIPDQRMPMDGCVACKPTNSKTIIVALYCPFLKKRRKHRKIQIVNYCQCDTCTNCS